MVYHGTPMTLCCYAKWRGTIPSSSSPSVWDKARCEVYGTVYGTCRTRGFRFKGTRHLDACDTELILVLYRVLIAVALYAWRLSYYFRVH